MNKIFKKPFSKQVFIFILIFFSFITAGLYFWQKEKTLSNDLKINEVAFNQKSNIDWIEIYNPSSKNVNLKGFYLTDDEKDLSQFKIENDLIIESGGFVVIYCNNYEGVEDNLTVTNFRISNGETIYLVGSDKSSKIDSLVLPVEDETQNKTYGRYPDGSDNLSFMSDYTPGETNSDKTIVTTTDIDYENIFDNESIKTVELTISNENLNEMSNYSSNSGPSQNVESEDPPYVSADLKIQDTTYENVAIRYKGNSSLSQSSNKLPYRIDMNKYIDGQTFEGVQEFVLNPNFKDSSQVREILSYQIMRDENIPSEYASYTKVYVNGEYIGLYTMVENVDEDFLNRNFDNNDGILVKAGSSGTNFEYIDDNIDSYSNQFEVKQGDDEQIQDFLSFLEFLNSDIDGDWEEQILEELDVYEVLDYFAMIVVQSSQDSYLSSGRNFYIYYDTDDEKYKIIPWDMNESFGVYGNNSVSWDIYDPTNSTSSSSRMGGGMSQSGGRPLFTQLMEVEEFEEYYLDKVKEYATYVVTIENLQDEIDMYNSQVKEAEGSSNSSELESFIEKRTTNILEQLEEL